MSYFAQRGKKIRKNKKKYQDTSALEEVKRIETKGEVKYILTVKEPEYSFCENCYETMKKHERRTRSLVDAPENNKKTNIEVIFSRYKCPKCRKMTSNECDFIARKRAKITRDAEKYILENIVFYSKSELAKMMGINEKTVRNILSKLSAK